MIDFPNTISNMRGNHGSLSKICKKMLAAKIYKVYFMHLSVADNLIYKVGNITSNLMLISINKLFNYVLVVRDNTFFRWPNCP